MRRCSQLIIGDFQNRQGEAPRNSVLITVGVKSDRAAKQLRDVDLQAL
jgi:hypothetical protein